MKKTRDTDTDTDTDARCSALPVHAVRLTVFRIRWPRPLISQRMLSRVDARFAGLTAVPPGSCSVASAASCTPVLLPAPRPPLLPPGAASCRETAPASRTRGLLPAPQPSLLPHGSHCTPVTALLSHAENQPTGC